MAASHPSRVRGLKSFYLNLICPRALIAPFTGARIEIPNNFHPPPHELIAHFTGARIEIEFLMSSNAVLIIAPFTGARIEITEQILTARR